MEKIIERVRKLLELSKSPNEHEAAAAAEKAHAILLENNLSLKDVSEKEEFSSQVVDVDSSNNAWQRHLRMGVAQLYLCGYYYVPRKHVTSSGKSSYNHDLHTYIGSPSSVEVAILMSNYLVKTGQRLAKEGSKTADKPWPYITSFLNAYSLRVYGRIMERIEAAKKGGSVRDSKGHYLPACLGLYETSEADFLAYLDRHGLGVETRSSRSRSSDLNGHFDGQKAGNSVSLDSQIGHSENPAIAASSS